MTVKFVTNESLRSYHYFGEEAEALGTRLDKVRGALANSKTEWARGYWQLAIDQLMLQWRSLPILHDGDAKMSIVPRWDIDYDFAEFRHDPVDNYGISDKIYNKIFNEPDLEKSWNRAIEEKLARCWNC